jgi:hypothetical protein
MFSHRLLETTKKAKKAPHTACRQYCARDAKRAIRVWSVRLRSEDATQTAKSVLISFRRRTEQKRRRERKLTGLDETGLVSVVDDRAVREVRACPSRPEQDRGVEPAGRLQVEIESAFELEFESGSQIRTRGKPKPNRKISQETQHWERT